MIEPPGARKQWKLMESNGYVRQSELEPALRRSV
jgi:hypothetical protein